MGEKIYTCECGKTFTKPNSFNGHKSCCKVHASLKGTLEQVKERWAVSGKITGTKQREEAEKRKEQELQLWLSEKHTCEKCGKVMTEKFGSGRFCSRGCANGRTQSYETRNRIGASIVKTLETQGHKTRKENEEKYLKNPSRCKICGCVLSYNDRLKHTCSKQCYAKLRADIRYRTIEEQGLNCGTLVAFKYGFYNGIECDSGWELAFLVYHLDNSIDIKRNKDGFTYVFDGVTHRYYPDFMIDDTYYEIKGYKDAKFYEKISQFPLDKKLVIIDAQDINAYIKYVVEKYGDQYYNMYDNDKPSWRDKS